MQDMLSSLMGGGNNSGNNQIAGSEAAEPTVQPLIIKQAPKPVFKTQESGADEGEEDGAVDAPEEEDLD